MHLFKEIILFFSVVLINCTWGALPKSDEHDHLKLDYQKLFPPSLAVVSSSCAEVFNILDQAIQASERDYYYWLLTHFPLLSTAGAKVTEIPQNLRVFFVLLRNSTFNVRAAVNNIDNSALTKDMDDKINAYSKLQQPQKGSMSTTQHLEALGEWERKHRDKFAAYRRIANSSQYFGEEQRVLLYELAYFLKLLPFETAFEALQTHKQKAGHSRILANILGDSLLDGGKSLIEFYRQFDTAVSTIGYLPADLQILEGANSAGVAGTLRDIIGGLLSEKNYSEERQKFVRRMWRAACTLHLSGALQVTTFRDSVKEDYWQEKYAPEIYRAIEVGNAEVFDSGYEIYNKDNEYISGHAMVVEVRRISEEHYHVKQFNSGSGIRNHKKWKGSTPSPVKRYSSFVNMPRLSEEQIEKTGYYAVTGQSPQKMIEKLYANKRLAKNPPYTYPLLYEKEQQAGTCIASSKMFYFRHFGLEGRLLEIDFKVALIKQLLDRIDKVQKSELSHTSLLESLRAERNARLAGSEEAVGIRRRREHIFKAAKIPLDDQSMLMFPKLYVSLIASALNEILENLYWIINNKKLGTAKTLFKHFIWETEPIFKSSPYGQELSERVSPLILSLHRRHFRGVVLPSTVHSQITQSSKESEDANATVSYVIGEIRKHCPPPSKDKLPTCFYHIINAIQLFPYAPKLATITLELSEQLNFNDVSPELSYLVLDAMRTAYGEDFAVDPRSMRQVAFASKLDGGYRAPEGTSTEHCGEYMYDEDVTVEELGHLARCVYLRNGPIKNMSLPERISVIKQVCMQLTLEKLPTCFYHIIKTFRLYPEAPELSAVTSEIQRTAEEQGIDFGKAPPALAFLIIDALRSVYGKEFVQNFMQRRRIAFVMNLPWNYYGERDLLLDCDKATDEDILSKWKWVAACRYEKKRVVDLNTLKS